MKKLVHTFTSLLMALAFVVVLGGIGAIASYITGATLHDGMRARQWVGVKANVESVGEGTVLYSYTFNERRYTGDRLGPSVFRGTDNVGDWQEQTKARLGKARSSGQPITVWVNPEKPSESMVHREIRWNLLVIIMVFALAFGAMGLGGLIAAVYTLLPERLKGRKWSEGERNLVAVWGVTFFWNVFSFPVAIVSVPQFVADGDWTGLTVMVLPLVGLGWLWGAIKGTHEYLHRGGAILTFTGAKPRVGGAAQGHIEFARGVKAGDAFRVRMVCVERRGSGENVTKRACWSEEVRARAVTSGAGARVDFHFDIPEKARPPLEGRWRWRVEVIAPDGAVAKVRYGFEVDVHAPHALAAVHT